MEDRVHPRVDSPPVTGNATDDQRPGPPKYAAGGDKPVPSFAPKPQPQPGTYVIQVPKDQIYRVPPPANAHKYRNAARRKNRGCCGCCCCLTYVISVLSVLVVILGIFAAVFYLTVRPKSPKYSVDSISVTGLNLSSSALSLSPEFDVTVRAENPNRGIGIYYGKKSSVAVSHSDIQLCTGTLPSFYQGTKNVTIFTTALKGSAVRLSDTVHDALISQQRKGQIPLKLNLKVPVKLKVWGINSWSVDVKVDCDVTVNKLAKDSRVLSKDCDVDVNPWWW
ncbi:hypothetical protein H6P81_007885 [Aristolochia fimbriata]|uniref:Late embryogenesis abundant protein LEA-2 subgroup domain-containing protein n=1 Tax=Aristolochia fimbriata TaxID=158543 RepID=A0AAV7F563_ARIFI|nr:hypothetical protein H6P81_007885 [Aristolochia fimbriata]